MFSNYFNVLMLKINLKNKKNINLIYFQIENTFKNNRYYNITRVLCITKIYPDIIFNNINFWFYSSN
jgi:hypothetical protein